MQYVKVLINKKIKELDRDFIYEVPPEWMGAVQIGSVVSVPFGHRTEKGIVVGFAESPGDFRVKYIDSVENESFVCPEDLLALADELSRYYMTTTIGMLKAMIPAGVNLFGEAQKPKTERWLVADEISEISLRGAKQRELAQRLKEQGAISFRDAASLGFSDAVCNGLVQKGLARKELRPISRYSYGNLERKELSLPQLTEEQSAALEKICQREEGDHRPILIHGVTGSGKTELYLRLAADTLAKGKQVIVLLPEIALTPQFVGIFENRFHGDVALFHSRLSRGERRDAWFAFRNGEARIALGARSCVFAPARELGMIIMDEEHEDSYEQDAAPRFHARKVAELRCAHHGAELVLGSATPSFESYEKALRGEYLLVSLPHRVGNTPLPQISVVDMREELKAGWTEVISRDLLAAIEETLAKGKQVILFLNRLGYHTFVSCRDCGFVYRCPHCDLALTYYEGGYLRCNRCEHEEKFVGICPECGSRRIKYFGLGVERLVSVVERLFPAAAVERLDSDSLREKGNIDDIYRRMKKREIQILIGTRMIAKGWDFSDVDLIGIVATDYMLNFPDFRSGEKTFQMVAQVAGRCGRSDRRGKVILQTYHPNEPVLWMGGMQDYDTYYRLETRKRREFGYPPYAHMMRIIFSMAEENDGQRKIILNQARRCFESEENVRIFGPAASIYKDYRKEKWVITLLGEEISLLREIINKGILRLKSEKLIGRDCSVQIETDPMHSV